MRVASSTHFRLNGSMNYLGQMFAFRLLALIVCVLSGAGCESAAERELPRSRLEEKIQLSFALNKGVHMINGVPEIPFHSGSDLEFRVSNLNTVPVRLHPEDFWPNLVIRGWSPTGERIPKLPPPTPSRVKRSQVVTLNPGETVRISFSLSSLFSEHVVTNGGVIELEAELYGGISEHELRRLDIIDPALKSGRVRIVVRSVGS